MMLLQASGKPEPASRGRRKQLIISHKASWAMFGGI
jgi:hypothetical protein